MAPMDEFDAYAPPQIDEGSSATRKKSKKKKASGAIAEAIARLNEHLADAEAVARDRKEVGGKLRGVTIGFIVFTILMGVGAIGLLDARPGRIETDPIVMASVILAGFFTFMTILLVIMDLTFPSRDISTSPENTTKYFFKAIAMNRLGYAWATLCPTAREQTVETPAIGAIPVQPGTFTLLRTAELKDYTQAFARPGNGQMRTMQIKRSVLVREEGDVATVEVALAFQSWPQWAQLISVVALVLFRLVGSIVFVILFFALRKTHEVVFQKTLIRGSNGVWYVYSGDLLEGTSESA
jgi:hypothetical protein